MTRPADTPPVPAGLDWDVWIGPAPMRPYNDAYVPFKWRGFWDFGTGAFGDMGCHILNWQYTALDLDAPISAKCIEEEGATKDSPPKKSRCSSHHAVVPAASCGSRHFASPTYCPT